MFNFFFKHIDNSSLVVFRILFGLLCFLESVGAIITGWVKRVMVEPEFTFSFIGFEWLQPLPGNGMYIYYAVMGLLGLFIMLGYKYRFSVIAFTVMWTGVYLMQKSSYNNHYYLLIFLSGLMAFQPAHRYYSIDAKLNPSIKSISMPRWCSWLFIIQMFIVYSYGAIAKLYGDWLDTTVMELLMNNKSHYWLIGNVLQEKWMHYFLAYGGVLFDGLIIPLLLWKPTRKLAFFASIFFHVFNSVVFQVGIFPYLSLAFILFFYEPKVIHNIFLRKKPFYNGDKVDYPKYKNLIIGFFIIYFSIHLILPIRHHAIKDNVLWTEEGHRMSWRMMLRVKYGYGNYKVIDKTTKEVYSINLNNYLTKKQQHGVKSKPDFIWQFAQYLKQDFAKQGKDVSVFASIFISVNGKPNKQLIDSNVDLADVEWDTFKHSTWILPSK
ncbi:HTTM domain-containing protein [Ichthyenterobacterium sp. W332]|uniref:HTTM domain-containing protein n=1 Tax=Microcosmobacter mediterraneus TaxID=3075607 RepID=A0ABU2YID3_9FLAO|nr:HTTM domain-containing protein [Ichthyenterobacterium sp. W332]MDT0557928.1 HTTM domain-containing protein [Ichthyenterobacterium sp. W332]